MQVEIDIQVALSVHFVGSCIGAGFVAKEARERLVYRVSQLVFIDSLVLLRFYMRFLCAPVGEKGYQCPSGIYLSQGPSGADVPQLFHPILSASQVYLEPYSAKYQSVFVFPLPVYIIYPEIQ